MPDKRKILFVCIGNACRSPMAEGFARHYGGDLIEAHSAGLSPYGEICEETIKVMQERGVDITSQRSKGIHEYVLRDFDLIVSMVPVPLTDRHGQLGEIFWDVRDPFRQPLTEFRRVRDEIEEKVLALLGQPKRTEPRRSSDFLRRKLSDWAKLSLWLPRSE